VSGRGERYAQRGHPGHSPSSGIARSSGTPKGGQMASDEAQAREEAAIAYEPPRVINRVDIAATLMPGPVSF